VQVPIHSGKPETPAERNVRIVREQDVAHPEAVVAILKPFDEQTAAGPLPSAVVGGQIMPLALAVKRFREANPGLGRLFDPKGTLDYRKLTPEVYIAVQTHAPELLGMKPIGQRW